MKVKKILRFLFLSCLVLCLCFVTACNRNNNGDINDDDLNRPNSSNGGTNNGNGMNNGTNNGNNGSNLDPSDIPNPDDPINDPLDPVDPMTPNDNGMDNGGNVNDDNIVPDNNLGRTPNIDSIFNAVSGAYGEDFYATSENDETFLTEKLGVDMADVESFFCSTAMDTTHPDIFVGVKAKDSSAADSVESALENYRESLVNGAKADNSVNAHKINNSEVVRHDDYVFLVALGRTDDTITDIGDAMTFAKDQIKIAVDKIAEFFR